jgi:hypothetical protein
MTAVSGPASRWLFVVARDQVDLLTFMNRDAFLDPDATVVWDRRVGDRRRAADASVPERRHGERRQLWVAEHMARYGFAVVDLERKLVIPPPAGAGRLPGR